MHTTIQPDDFTNAVTIRVEINPFERELVHLHINEHRLHGGVGATVVLRHMTWQLAVAELQKLGIAAPENPWDQPGPEAAGPSGDVASASHAAGDGMDSEDGPAEAGIVVPPADSHPDRGVLLRLCEAGFRQQERWANRDSASAQRQLGEAYALLKAGCEFVPSLSPDGGTWWVTIWYEGFDTFEYGREDRNLSQDRFYIPSADRLHRVGPDSDWY